MSCRDHSAIDVLRFHFHPATISRLLRPVSAVVNSAGGARHTTRIKGPAGESSIGHSGKLFQCLHSNHVVKKHEDSTFRRLDDCHLLFSGRAQRYVASVVDGGGLCRHSATDRRSDLLACS